MRAEVIDEPELEFGGRGRHIDPRFGIGNYGPADLGSQDAPRAVRVGLIGPADQLDGLRTWLERCREPIPAKDEKYPHLFPSFPGCDIDSGLQTTLVFSDRNTRTISDGDLRAIRQASGGRALQSAIDTYAAEITGLADENRLDVLLAARPEQLADTARTPRRRGRRSPEATASVPEDDDVTLPQYANFHDLLKARTLALRQPIQIIRRSTWDEAKLPVDRPSRQDEATRAWNLHVAVYWQSGWHTVAAAAQPDRLRHLLRRDRLLQEQQPRHARNLRRPGLQPARRRNDHPRRSGQGQQRRPAAPPRIRRCS